MNYDHKHQMAFLLSLAVLPIGGGCVITDGDDDDGVGDDTGTNSNSATVTADDDGSTSASATLDDTGTVSVDESGTSAATVDDTGTTGGEVPAVCVEVGAHFEKCGFTDAADKLDECVYYVDDPTLTPECLEANEAYYACLAAAACADLEGDMNPCALELDMIVEACVGGAESSSGDSGGSGSSSSG